MRINITVHRGLRANVACDAGLRTYCSPATCFCVVLIEMKLANRTARQTAQNRHREWLHRPERSALRARARRGLRGLRLGCWCEQPGPCHGHNLCEVADADIDDDADDAAP